MCSEAMLFPYSSCCLHTAPSKSNAHRTNLIILNFLSVRSTSLSQSSYDYDKELDRHHEASAQTFHCIQFNDSI
jgi:hypothetical protein